MDQDSAKHVSRDLIRAVLETRDHRHNETHAMLLALYQGLLAELVEQGVLAPRPLAERLRRSKGEFSGGPHGTAARDILAHVVSWLEGTQPGLPPVHPGRWNAPAPGEVEEE